MDGNRHPAIVAFLHSQLIKHLTTSTKYISTFVCLHTQHTRAVPASSLISCLYMASRLVWAPGGQQAAAAVAPTGLVSIPGNASKQITFAVKSTFARMKGDGSGGGKRIMERRCCGIESTRHSIWSKNSRLYALNDRNKFVVRRYSTNELSTVQLGLGASVKYLFRCTLLLLFCLYSRVCLRVNLCWCGIRFLVRADLFSQMNPECICGA